MNKTFMLLYTLVLMAIVVCVGCVGAPVTFKSMADVKYDATKGRTVSGSSCGFQLLLFIPININDRYSQAYEELLKNAGPGNYVTDIKVSESWKYAFVGTVYCTDLMATAYPQLEASVK